MTSKTKASLEKLRGDIISKIRLREPVLMRELEAIDLALSNLDPDRSSTEYARYVQGIDAVEAYLPKRVELREVERLRKRSSQEGGGRTMSEPRARF